MVAKRITKIVVKVKTSQIKNFENLGFKSFDRTILSQEERGNRHQK